MVIDLICPECGSPVLWCNGGDVNYDFSSQFRATYPSLVMKTGQLLSQQVK